jgi:hypothetical protein
MAPVWRNVPRERKNCGSANARQLLRIDAITHRAAPENLVTTMDSVRTDHAPVMFNGDRDRSVGVLCRKTLKRCSKRDVFCRHRLERSGS